MLDSDLQLRVGSVATDFFLNLIAVTALVALPIMIPFTTPARTPPAASSSRPLAEVRGEREAAERTLAHLETERSAMENASEREAHALAVAAAGLRADLARLTTENAALAIQIAQARATPRASSFGVPLARETDRKAVFFILADGLLVPINKDGGRFSAVNANGGLVVFTPLLAGDPIPSISEGKSPAGRAVAAINPGKEFAFIFLRDDSFKAFYQLRGVLQQRGIALGWAPLTSPNRQVAFASGNNGRRPDIND